MAADITGGVEYPFGAQVRLKMFVRQNGALLDPSGEVTIILEEPDGTETVLIYNGGAGAIQKEAVGTYYYDHTTAQAGVHEYRMKTVSPIGVQESYFVVLASRVANP